MRGGRVAKRRSRIGVRWQMFVCLALFAAILLVVLWVFQVRLLSFFYEREKFSEIQGIADALERKLTDKDIDERAEDYAMENAVCVCVFRIKGDRAERVANADIAPDCVIHHLSPQLLADMYEEACESGGVYDRRFEFSLDETEKSEGHLPQFLRAKGAVSAVHARVVEKDGITYFLMIDSDLSPVDATVRTLEMQFIWIAGILLVSVLLLAVLLSRIVATPLIMITQKAGRLADGEFEVDFSGAGYREVQELADALSHASNEIGATSRLQKELVANISHDLRTPLTMIKGYSEMMRDIPGENTPENMQVVIDETTRLSELVNDLMDLSKLQAGTRRMEKSVFDLTATIRDVMQRYDTLIRHEGYRFELELQGEAYVEADRTMILQVIYNLINNAVNYTGESMRVRVIESVGERCVRFSVADDGAGIAPDQIHDIWDRYYRVDKEHKRAVMGTGLGLSIVKEALEAHGAAYGVDSAVGVGSVFWFELPLASPSTNEE